MIFRQSKIFTGSFILFQYGSFLANLVLNTRGFGEPPFYETPIAGCLSILGFEGDTPAPLAL